MIVYQDPNFSWIRNVLHETLLDRGQYVDTGHWQAVKDVPMTKTLELQNVVIQCSIPKGQAEASDECRPNLPWAEDHFQERVAGEPLNPGEQYKNWPWYKGNVEQHQTQGDDSTERQFSHTYMERFWPRYARDHFSDIPLDMRTDRLGIRFRYGDLRDLLTLLAREPQTRQAYLPIWFPEDLAAAAQHEERVPCSLGYHFMLRDGFLHCSYFMRSVDFVRYFQDDAYMAMRLTQWVFDQLSHTQFLQMCIGPGNLVMTMSSLHCFEGDLPKLERERPQ